MYINVHLPNRRPSTRVCCARQDDKARAAALT
jgi:hypothetical protein